LVVVIPYIHKNHENYLKPSVEKIPEKAGLKKPKLSGITKRLFINSIQKNVPIGGLVMVLST
jgi:hypothetical protein